MTDEQLIAALMAANDTLSRGGAEQVIRIVREHDQGATVIHVTREQSKKIGTLVAALKRRNGRRAARRNVNPNYATIDDRETELFEAVERLVAEPGSAGK